MPIRRELRHHYGEEWLTVTRPRILKRAGGVFDAEGVYLGFAKCETCGAVDTTEIIRHEDFPRIYFSYPSGRAFSYDGRPFIVKKAPRDLFTQKLIRVQIGIAHVNNIAGDDRDENLLALCRYCHLVQDIPHHHWTRATRKDDLRPLFNDAFYEGYTISERRETA